MVTLQFFYKLYKATKFADLYTGKSLLFTSNHKMFLCYNNFFLFCFCFCFLFFLLFFLQLFGVVVEMNLVLLDYWLKYILMVSAKGWMNGKGERPPTGEEKKLKWTPRKTDLFFIAVFRAFHYILIEQCFGCFFSCLLLYNRLCIEHDNLYCVECGVCRE